jgi:hypothetical protein
VAVSRVARIQTADRTINQIQDNIDRVVDNFAASPLASGALLQSISLVTGSNEVNHTLNRKLVGWVITRNRANATFFDTQDSNPIPTKTLRLTASAPVVVDLFVF